MNKYVLRYNAYFRYNMRRKMEEIINIMNGIKRLLLLKGRQSNGSVLSRKIKVSRKQENKYKKGECSVLSTKIY